MNKTRIEPLLKISNQQIKKKHRQTLDIIYVIACITIAFLFGSYTIATILDGILSLYLIPPIAATLLSVSALIFRNKIPRVLWWIVFFGMYAWIISYIVLSSCILIFSAKQEQKALTEFDKNAKVTVMIFGCRTFGYTPGKSLESRLESALILLEHYPNSVCVVSGGEGPNEGISEAESMSAWLEARGINSDRIYKEDMSTNTVENIKYSLELIKKEELSSEMLIGVSNRYHLMRISWIANGEGVNMTLYPSDSDNLFWLSIYLLREYMSYIKIGIGL